jgi:hypothetical protein
VELGGGMNSAQRYQWVKIGAQRAQDANHGNGDVKSGVYPTRAPGIRSHENRRVGGALRVPTSPREQESRPTLAPLRIRKIRAWQPLAALASRVSSAQEPEFGKSAF